MSDQLFAQAEHQHVVCKMVEWSTLFGEDAGSPTFAPDVKLHTPEDQALGHRDRVVVLEVLTKGPGNVSRGMLNPCTAAPGDMLLANHYHRGLTFSLCGEEITTFNWEFCMAQLHVHEEDKVIGVTPLQAYVLCKRNEKRAEPIFMGCRAKGHRIILPGADAVNAGDMQYNERGKPVLQPKVACEEVLQCGPGAVVDGMWCEPQCKPGDMVIYDTSVAPVQVRIQGQAYTLVHFRHVIMTVRDHQIAPEAEAPAQTDPKEQAFADASAATVH